jgi:NAD(P)-dependent dehydrogenase (short-subunit alcohol dehydrogenase family)
MQISLANRTALVTGGSLGLGRAIAESYAGAGAEVAILARRQEVLDQAASEIEAATGKAVHAFACDVRDAAQIKAVYARAEQALGGRVDILVNNAGTSRTGKFMEITDEVWAEDLDLKFYAAVRMIRLALPGMRQRRWGRIINVLNIGAKAPRAGGMPTVVSRAAGMAMTKALAGEVAADNVLVNALLVGLIVSDQWLQRHKKSGGNESFEEFTGKMGATIPLGRMGEPREFASLACFLASDAGGYVTGTAINVDGGLSPVV